MEEVVSTWVGFVDDVAVEGERRASMNWPIQYQWADYMAETGDRLAYRVLPVGPDKANLRPAAIRSANGRPR